LFPSIVEDNYAHSDFTSLFENIPDELVPNPPPLTLGQRGPVAKFTATLTEPGDFTGQTKSGRQPQ